MCARDTRVAFVDKSEDPNDVVERDWWGDYAACQAACRWLQEPTSAEKERELALLKTLRSLIPRASNAIASVYFAVRYRTKRPVEHVWTRACVNRVLRAMNTPTVYCNAEFHGGGKDATWRFYLTTLPEGITKETYMGTLPDFALFPYSRIVPGMYRCRRKRRWLCNKGQSYISKIKW